MTITARFESECGRCGERIGVGEQINWVRGEKATHIRPCQRVAAAAPVARMAIEDAGVYVMPGGVIVKVKANREKTRTYAMRWVVINGERLTEAGTREHGEYVYEAGLVQRVAIEGRKMTLTEAKAFTLRFGICCRCGRSLKAAESVERAIGPVCVKYFSFAAAAVEPEQVEEASTLGFAVGVWPNTVIYGQGLYHKDVPMFDREHELTGVVYRDQVSGRKLVVVND